MNKALHGIVLAIIMFLIYLNNMMEGLSSFVNLFVDDGELMRIVKN